MATPTKTTSKRRTPTPQESIQAMLYESLFFVRGLETPGHLQQALDKASEAVNAMQTLIEANQAGGHDHAQ